MREKSRCFVDVCFLGCCLTILAAVKSLPGAEPTAAVASDDGKLRIICFGAHPDDCELRTAGVAAKWAALGHHVKYGSETN